MISKIYKKIKFYVPHTAEQYLRSAGVVTIVRVLGLNGYQADSVQLVAMNASFATIGLEEDITCKNILKPFMKGKRNRK